MRDVTPDDAGWRVTLRWALPDGGHSEAVGVLESWADGRLVVRRRDGSTVTVEERSLVAARRVSPPGASGPGAAPGPAGRHP